MEVETRREPLALDCVERRLRCAERPVKVLGYEWVQAIALVMIGGKNQAEPFEAPQQCSKPSSVEPGDRARYDSAGPRDGLEQHGVGAARERREPREQIAFSRRYRPGVRAQDLEQTPGLPVVARAIGKPFGRK